MKIIVRKVSNVHRDIRVELDNIKVDLGLHNLDECQELAKQLIEAAGDLMPNSFSIEGAKELRKLIDDLYGCELD